MGTNYYLIYGEKCQHCGAGPVKRHIGKSSAGWNFALHIYPEEGINNLSDWVDLFTDETTRIIDEYNRVIESRVMFVKIVKQRGRRRNSSGLGVVEHNGTGHYDLIVAPDEDW